jgi:hypothetical protein
VPNTSATGGYLTGNIAALPAGLTIERFLHGVIMGITGLTAANVRPRWQENPPKQPDINTNWCGFGITIHEGDANAYFLQDDDSANLKRHEKIELLCSFYGSAASTNAQALRDGLQLSQNREQLFLAGLGYSSAESIQHVPELVNERWVNRSDITIYFMREIIRTYAILPLLDADGTIETDNDPQIIVQWSTENVITE